MNKIFSALLLAAAFLFSGAPCTAAVPASAPEQREQSIKDMDKLLDKRLFKQAAEQALKQLNEYDDQYSGKDLALYYRALQNLNGLNDSTNLDTILQEQMKRHGENPWFLMAAAELYQTASHTFKLADGKYIRVSRPWQGEYSGQKRDKVEALRCLLKAMDIAERNKDMKLLGLARFMMAKALLKNYGYYQPFSAFQTYAALGNLTGLEKLPGYVSNQEAPEFRNVSTLPVVVNPATGKTEIVFYHASSSWSAARNDGERVRWLLDAAVRADPELENEVSLFTASWCRNLLSYANTAPYQEFVYGPGNAGSVEGINPADLKTDQTVVRTDRTDKGQFMLITLPPDYDFIRIASRVTPSPYPAEPYLDAAKIISGEFLVRNQRPAAADVLKKTLQTYKDMLQAHHERGGAKPPESDAEETVEYTDDTTDSLQEELASITEPNGAFEEDERTLLSGEPVSMAFIYRNAASASITARPVNVRLWQEERINTLLASKKLGKNYEKKYSGFDTLLSNLLNDKSAARYLGKEIKGESISLEPGNQHLDRIAQLSVPVSQPGWYLLTVTLNNGYRFHRLLSLSDLVLIRRSIPEGNLWFLAQAKTGVPVEGGKISLVRYRENKTLQTKQVKGTTDKNGVLVETLPPNDSNSPTYYNLLGIATHGDSYVVTGGRKEWYSGESRMSLNNKVSSSYGCFFLESQPVYRPGQTARFRGVLFRPDFANPGTKDCAGKKLTLTILSPIGDKGIFPEQTVTTDATGGFDLELFIPHGAPLGQYRATLDFREADRILYAPLFRMEEYKKPEFTVKMDAPDKPLRLGQPIPVSVQADYYAGGPVSEGKATITITRTLGAEVWTPYWKWSWLYSRKSSPYYTCFTSDPPLTVLEKTIPLDKEGKATVELSTEQDARDFASQDITYRISVSVTDASLREVSASGQVIATCRPFNIFTSLSRGYAPAGVPVRATITAATADGVKIGKAKGKSILYRVHADSSRQSLAEWDVVTNEEGSASLTFQTGDSGLYLLQITLEDSQGGKVESSRQFLSYGTGEHHPFKINPLSITPDKNEYAPGETASLLIASDYPDAHVWTFLRNSWKNESRRLVALDRQTALVECPLTREDMPNMGVNAFTVRNGELHQASAELLLPPASQMLEPAVSPSRPRYQPGEKGRMTVQVKGPDGSPVKNGIVTLAVYDKALEYIARPNVSNIAETTWGGLNGTRFLNISAMQDKGTEMENGPDQPYFEPLAEPDLSMPFGDFAGGIGRGGSRTGDFAISKRSANGMLSKGMSFPQTPPTPVMQSMRDAEMADAFGEEEVEDERQGASPAIQLRTNFADSIKWCGTLKTDEEGMVAVPVDMPDNLTTWKAAAWVVTSALQVGQASAEFLTTKNFMVSLQAPRFFVEKDIVMLSAIVRNRTDKDVLARISITLKNGCLSLMPGNSPALNGLGAGTDNAASRKVTVPAQGQVTVNWWTTAIREGTATVAMEAAAGSLGDAMQMDFPVLVHGMKQLHADSTVLLRGDQERQLTINLPQQRRREESRLVVKVSPSIALSMVEALPYLAEYPYGCVEQTLNRFLPAVIVTDTLKQLGLDPGQALESHRNLNPQAIRDKAFYDKIMERLERNPVYSERKLKAMAEKGIRDLREKQLSDGSWGWFGGADRGDPVMTAHVVHGLKIAGSTVKLPGNMLLRAVSWLTGHQNRQLALLVKGDAYRKLEKQPDGPATQKAIRELGDYRLTASASDVLIYSVLAENGVRNLQMERYLFRDRLELPVISQIQLAEILLDAHRMDDFKEIMPVISQFLQQDDSLQTAWLRLPNQGYWWRWYGSNVATQAAYLKLMAKSDPKNPVTSRLAKWLLNNRANGSYWNSTKDTADCLEALSAYLFQTREGMEDMEAEILYDGVPVKTVSSTKETLFTFDNEWSMSGKNLTDGQHRITIRRKKGNGSIYAGSTLSYFSLEDPIPAAGNAVTVERSYYRMEKETVKEDSVKDTQTDAGELVSRGRDQTRRTLLKDGDIIASGDIIEVVMSVKTKNDVEYLMLSDPKPAGCESRDTVSGYAWMGTVSGYKEIGDEEIRVFLSSLPMGEYQISHRLRAERPGRFSALPAVLEAMYAPELRGNSREHKISISMPKP